MYFEQNENGNNMSKCVGGLLNQYLKGLKSITSAPTLKNYKKGGNETQREQKTGNNKYQSIS